MALKRFVMSEGSEGSLSALSSLQNREVIAVGEGVEAPVRLMSINLKKVIYQAAKIHLIQLIGIWGLKIHIL